MESEFIAWLQSRVSEKTFKDYTSYLSKIGISCDPRWISRIYIAWRNSWVVKLLRHITRFCFEMGYIRFEDFYRLCTLLKVPRSMPRHIVVGDIRIPERGLVATIYRVMLFSGCRLEEAAKMINEFDEERLVCFEDRGFCRYGLFWYRGKKKCEWIYMPIEVAKDVKRAEGIAKPKSVSSYARKRNLTRASAIRKFHYRLCIDVVQDRDVCDFYQSRSLSVGAKHYDLILNRADQAYPMLMEAISQRLGVPV